MSLSGQTGTIDQDQVDSLQNISHLKACIAAADPSKQMSSGYLHTLPQHIFYLFDPVTCVFSRFRSMSQFLAMPSDKSSFILETDIEDNAGCASSFDWLLHRRGHSQQRTQAIQRLTQSNRRIVQINMNISNNITITNGCTSLTICCVMNQMNDMMAGLPNMCTLADEVSQTSQTILGVHPCMTRRR